MKQKSIKFLIVGFSIIILIGLIPEYSNAQKVTKLFEKGQYDKAELYCVKQKGEKQQNCYKELAEAYLGKEDYEKSAEFYAKINNAEEGYLKIADTYLKNSTISGGNLQIDKDNDYLVYSTFIDNNLHYTNLENLTTKTISFITDPSIEIKNLLLIQNDILLVFTPDIIYWYDLANNIVLRQFNPGFKYFSNVLNPEVVILLEMEISYADGNCILINASNGKVILKKEPTGKSYWNEDNRPTKLNDRIIMFKDKEENSLEFIDCNTGELINKISDFNNSIYKNATLLPTSKTGTEVYITKDTTITLCDVESNKILMKNETDLPEPFGYAFDGQIINEKYLSLFNTYSAQYYLYNIEQNTYEPSLKYAKLLYLNDDKHFIANTFTGNSILWNSSPLEKVKTYEFQINRYNEPSISNDSLLYGCTNFLYDLQTGENVFYKFANDYYQKANYKEGYNKIALKYLDDGQPTLALSYFNKYYDSDIPTDIIKEVAFKYNEKRDYENFFKLINEYSLLNEDYIEFGDTLCSITAYEDIVDYQSFSTLYSTAEIIYGKSNLTHDEIIVRILNSLFKYLENESITTDFVVRDIKDNTTNKIIEYISEEIDENERENYFKKWALIYYKSVFSSSRDYIAEEIKNILIAKNIDETQIDFLIANLQVEDKKYMEALGIYIKYSKTDKIDSTLQSAFKFYSIMPSSYDALNTVQDKATECEALNGFCYKNKLVSYEYLFCMLYISYAEMTINKMNNDYNNRSMVDYYKLTIKHTNERIEVINKLLKPKE